MDSGKPTLRVVVDTNVTAYFLLRTAPFAQECRAFWLQVRHAVAPSSWESELCNVLWLAVRAGVVTLSQGIERLRIARDLGIVSVPVNELWEGALSKAVANDHPAYDVLFVELAQRTGRRLATFDGNLIRLFPHVASRPRDLLGGS